MSSAPARDSRLATPELEEFLKEIHQASKQSVAPTSDNLRELRVRLSRNSAEFSSDVWFQCVAEHARLCYSAGYARLALDPVSEAIELAEGAAKPSQRRLMLTLLGVLQIDAGNFPASLEALTEALQICESLNDPCATASVLINTTTALIDSGFARNAKAACEAAIKQAQAVQEPALRTYLLAAALNNAAFGALHTGNYREGLIAGREALRLIGDPPATDAMRLELKANALRNFGNLLLRVRFFSEAAECIAAATALLDLGPLGTRARASIQNLRGLHDVYIGNTAAGFSLLRETAEEMAGCHKDVEIMLLRSLVEAHEVGGDAATRDEYKRRLAEVVQCVERDKIVFHCTRSVQRLSPQAPSASATRAPRAELLVGRKERKQFQILEDICIAVEMQDDPTGEHPYRVGRLARLLAAEAGQDPASCFEIEVAARLHDIGKTGVPSEIIRTPGPLDETATTAMRQHSACGAELLKTLGYSSTSKAYQVARHHHERWDGSGYPDGLDHEDIPLAARITSICEAFDAMTHDRAYRPKLSQYRALELIQNHAGVHYDPLLTPMFVKLTHKLIAEHGDLDAYLAKGAHASSAFLRCKQRLTSQIERWGKLAETVASAETRP